jgi:hypothetical protein
MIQEPDRASLHRLIRLLVCASLALPTVSKAGLADELEDLVGYMIVAAKIVDGWKDGRKFGDGFEGCEHGRVIVFTDGTALTCNTYSYSYSYRPTAVILAKQFKFQGREAYSFKMVIDDEVYDMSLR